MNGTMPSGAHTLNANFQSVPLITLHQSVVLVDNFHFKTATTPRNLANERIFAYKSFINWHYNGLHSSSSKAFLYTCESTSMSHVGKRMSFIFTSVSMNQIVIGQLKRIHSFDIQQQLPNSIQLVKPHSFRRFKLSQIWFHTLTCILELRAQHVTHQLHIQPLHIRNKYFFTAFQLVLYVCKLHTSRCPIIIIVTIIEYDVHFVWTVNVPVPVRLHYSMLLDATTFMFMFTIIIEQKKKRKKTHFVQLNFLVGCQWNKGPLGSNERWTKLHTHTSAIVWSKENTIWASI